MVLHGPFSCFMDVTYLTQRLVMLLCMLFQDYNALQWENWRAFLSLVMHSVL